MDQKPPEKPPEILLKPPPPKVDKPLAYTIVTSSDLHELDVKISKMLDGGTWKLHGQPFVFRDQVCQAMTSQFLRG
jgi:hypothetical protein